MDKWEDFYSILQVHNRAEPEIIDSAYRRLSKKYHPDINKSKTAEEIMKRINIAYDTLSNTRKRSLYDVTWSAKMNPARATNFYRNESTTQKQTAGNAYYGGFGTAATRRQPADKAAEILQKYYNSILNKDFQAAYTCISKYDRKNIKIKDFIQWQTAVSETVELREVQVAFYKKHFNKRMGGTVFNEIGEYNVHIYERDLSNGKFYDYTATKSVVRDDVNWGVYLGYQNVRLFKEKFKNQGKVSVDTDRAMEHWLEYQSKHDELTGLLNQRGFLEFTEREVIRSKRYASAFTIALFEIAHHGNRQREDQYDELIKKIGVYLVKTFRKVDIVARWNDSKFIVLLVETDMNRAVKVVNRICVGFNEQMLTVNRRDNYYVLFAGINPFDANSMESTIKKCSSNLSLAKRSGRLKTVSGIYTKLRRFRAVKRFTR